MRTIALQRSTSCLFLAAVVLWSALCWPDGRLGGAASGPPSICFGVDRRCLLTHTFFRTGERPSRLPRPSTDFVSWHGSTSSNGPVPRPADAWDAAAQHGTPAVVSRDATGECAPQPPLHVRRTSLLLALSRTRAHRPQSPLADDARAASWHGRLAAWSRASAWNAGTAVCVPSAAG